MNTYIIDMILTWIWNAIIVTACGYVVFWRGQSGWWFLVAIVLLANINKETKLALLRHKKEQP